MTKILFVDDDAIARRNITNRIDWSFYNWELIYTARNGMDALEFIKDNQPDIILSDIKMPVMDGIQMSLIAKNYYPNIKFIFLSGYKEFEYAQQALKLNAVDYLNKPIDNQQLIEVLKKAEQLHKQEQKVDTVMNDKFPLIKRHYISKLMHNNFKGTDNSIFKAFDINLRKGLGICAFMDFKYEGPLEQPELIKQIQLLCNLLSEKYVGSFFLCMDNLQVFMIYTVNHTNDINAFHESLHILEQYINQYLKNQLDTTGIFHYGSIMYELNDLYRSYENALQEKNSEIYNLLSEVRHYIKTNYGNPDLTLLQLANHFNINHCYLTSVYKEKFGTNLYEHLIHIRMEKAGELLRTTTLKSYQIAEQVGYNNSQYFSISFKKHFNYTVTQYKDKFC